MGVDFEKVFANKLFIGNEIFEGSQVKASALIIGKKSVPTSGMGSDEKISTIGFSNPLSMFKALDMQTVNALFSLIIMPAMNRAGYQPYGIVTKNRSSIYIAEHDDPRNPKHINQRLLLNVSIDGNALFSPVAIQNFKGNLNHGIENIVRMAKNPLGNPNNADIEVEIMNEALAQQTMAGFARRVTKDSLEAYEDLFRRNGINTNNTISTQDLLKKAIKGQ